MTSNDVNDILRQILGDKPEAKKEDKPVVEVLKDEVSDEFLLDLTTRFLNVKEDFELLKSLQVFLEAHLEDASNGTEQHRILCNLNNAIKMIIEMDVQAIGIKKLNDNYTNRFTEEIRSIKRASTKLASSQKAQLQSLTEQCENWYALALRSQLPDMYNP